MFGPVGKPQNVKEKFDTTTKAAEADYVSHLKTHNEAVVEQLSAKQSIIHSTMETLQSQASTEERRAHQEMMEKTSANLTKLGDIGLPNPKPHKRHIALVILQAGDIPTVHG